VIKVSVTLRAKIHDLTVAGARPIDRIVPVV
jgi:hypothetical protein